MNLNKRALGALASFYDRRGMVYFGGSDRKVLRDLFFSCIIMQDEYNRSEISRIIQHADIFFRVNTTKDAYTQRLNDKSVAKLLRCIARNGKFPEPRSLRYA